MKYCKKSVVVCIYSTGRGQLGDRTLKHEVTPCSLQRRVYYLVNNPKYVLVHYFDVSNHIDRL